MASRFSGRLNTVMIAAAVLGWSASQPAWAQASPDFQLPFPCGQVWTGATYQDHSPIEAVDFNRPGDEGDLVISAEAGRVSRIEDEGATGYGRWVEIDHGNGWTTRYAHLSSQTVGLGADVRRGDAVGRVGDTGHSTGSHLHFEQRTGGKAVKVSFGGQPIHYWGEADYSSANGC